MTPKNVNVFVLFCMSVAACLAADDSPIQAQEAPAGVQIRSVPGRSVRSVKAVDARAKAQAAQAAAQKAGAKAAEKKPEGGEKKPDDKGDGKKPEGGTPDTITRPKDPDSPPDPSELELRPNGEGKLRLNFTGQPWPDVLEWLKKVSNVTLDWQELPGGYLNLVTHREYSVADARSLINRHLLARGYTIVINGELMTVEKIEKLNQAIVPRVTAESLDDRDPYEFVKVSFKLEGMLAEDAAAEFEPMKSPNGKLTALSSSNWLEAMDAVINLRDIRDAVLAMQTVPEEEQLVRPFYLEHVRAQDIVNPLRELLGLPPVATRGGGGGGGGGFNPGQMQQVVQQMQQMVQQMQQAAQQNKGGGGSAARSRRQEKIYIVPVERDNAVLVSGPPNKMALVENAIDILDQPAVGPSSALDSIAETEVFRLAKLNPETFETMLRDMGGLSPYTKLQVDKVRRTVIVTGPKTDRLIVQLMIEKLDGSSRSFHVIPLRKHQSDYVAGSIRFMMGLEEEDDSSSSRRGYFFYPYGRGQQEEEDPSDKFRVDADVEYNRLLLWCNNLELDQIKSLLVELGELPVPGGNRNRRRVYELDSIEDALDLIERLQKAWPSRGPNKLDIIPPVIEPKPREDADPIGPQAPDKVEVKPADKTASDRKEEKPGSETNGRVARNSVTTIPSQPRLARLMGLLSVSQLQDAADDSEAGSSAAPSDDADTTEVPATSDDATSVPPVRPVPLDDPAARFQRLLEELKQKRQAESGATPERPSATAEPAPIQIRIGPNGEIILESDDTYALDMLEDVMQEYAPPKRDWRVFELKYPNTWAYGIEVILRDVFKEEMEDEDGGNSYRYDPWMGFSRSRSSGNSGPRRMSKRKPLKIISDRDTHTILVQGASREQLHTIEELIAIYDKPESTDDHAVRKTQVFKIQYSTANVIADAIKDVYRDLLSENDKALQQQGRGDKEQRPAERSYTYIYGSGGGGEGQEKEQPIRFKGMLSIGVDKVSNILIVSASEGLLDNVGQIITALDEAARPNSAYQVMHVDPRVNTRELQQRLQKIFGPKPPQQNQNQNQKNNQQNQPGQNQNQPNGAGGRG